MGQEHSKQDRSESRKANDQSWLKEAVGSLTKDDKKRAEEEIDGATDRIEQAAGSLSEGRAKEASSTLSMVGTEIRLQGQWTKPRGGSKRPRVP